MKNLIRSVISHPVGAVFLPPVLLGLIIYLLSLTGIDVVSSLPGNELVVFGSFFVGVASSILGVKSYYDKKIEELNGTIRELQKGNNTHGFKKGIKAQEKRTKH